MGEEFQESDVVFSDYSSYVNNYPSTNHNSRATYTTSNHTRKKKIKKKKGNNISMPINIPESGFRYVDVIEYRDHDDDNDNDDDLDGDDDVGIVEERLPPHLIVARRINNVGREMACSFCIQDDKGRVLKGRNLCEVRNSILRLTGFYET